MRTMIKYSIWPLGLWLCMSACSMLDSESKSSLPGSKLEMVEGCEAMVMGVYNLMQNVDYYGRNLVAAPEVLADNCRMTQGGSRFRDQANNVIGAHINIWTTSYSQIASLNEVIENIQKQEQTPKARAVYGEALFLRGLGYFNLSIIYSREPGKFVDDFDLGVPLILKPFYYSGGNLSEEASPAREKADMIWKQVEDDLNAAYDLLKDNDGGLLPHRASAVAVKALLSRVYLHQGKWDDCITAATEAIDAAPFGVYGGTYTDVFKSSAETLFEIYYTNSENLGSSSLHSTYGVSDNGKRDENGYGDGVGSGDADLCLAEDLVALFDQQKDKRFGAMRKAIRNGEKVWWTTKFNSWQGNFGLDNVPVIRVSELYLNRAEAYAEKKMWKEARADVDEIRTKRGLGAATVVDVQLLKEILLQRRLEFVCEGHRFFDLKRRGEDITKPLGKPVIPYEDFRVVARIPETEMDVNGNLVDNPGY